MLRRCLAATAAASGASLCAYSRILAHSSSSSALDPSASVPPAGSTATPAHACLPPQPLRLAKDDESSAEPTYTAAEVSSHHSPESGVWVTLGDGVYDVTSFVRHHPGGDHILAAAGGPLEPLWAHWQVHLTHKVLRHLAPLRIGRLAPADRLSGVYNIADPYADEPPRDPRLGVLSARPFDSETARHVLASEFWTPQELFYVRNHLPVPRIDAAAHKLTIDAGDGGVRTFTTDELCGQFPQTRLNATLQCTGNRCNEIEPSAAGGVGQIGHACWQGVRLCDVFSSLPASTRHPPAEGLHLHAAGADGYAVSIPLEKALDERGDVMLVHSMNGEPLSRDHGGPIRLLVPGVVGARSVKWVQHLSVQSTECTSVWQKRYYRVFPPWVRDIHDIDYNDSSAPPIYDFPVQSAIIVPSEREEVCSDSDGKIPVRGYAVSGAGQHIVSVRVSADGGKSWMDATLLGSDAAGLPMPEPPHSPPLTKPSHARHWSWVLWEARVPIPATGQVLLCSKATDSAYNTQPEHADYNLRGYLSNAWSKVRVWAKANSDTS